MTANFGVVLSALNPKEEENEKVANYWKLIQKPDQISGDPIAIIGITPIKFNYYSLQNCQSEGIKQIRVTLNKNPFAWFFIEISIIKP